jgi:hypothetical protein
MGGNVKGVPTLRGALRPKRPSPEGRRSLPKAETPRIVPRCWGKRRQTSPLSLRPKRAGRKDRGSLLKVKTPGESYSRRRLEARQGHDCDSPVGRHERGSPLGGNGSFELLGSLGEPQEVEKQPRWLDRALITR